MWERPKDFDRIAKEFHVDYAFHKVAPATTCCFSKRDRRTPSQRPSRNTVTKVLNKGQDKASILGQLRKFTEHIRTQAEGEAANQRGGEGRTLSDKIRKYVLPNLPYLFVFWFFSKVGTAYRIAPGADFGTKLMGMLDTFPKAFENYWPGLGGLDLLVGLAGAAGDVPSYTVKNQEGKKIPAGRGIRHRPLGNKGGYKAVC